MLVRVAPWDPLGSALKEDVRVPLAVLTMALPGDTRYAPGAGVIKAKSATGVVVVAHLSPRRSIARMRV